MKVNKKRKFLGSVLVKAFDGNNKNEIVQLFKGVDQSLIEKYITPTLNKDHTETKDEAVLEIYSKVKPGEPLIVDNAHDTLNNLFFNPRRYSLADVGRYKINKKLGLKTPIQREHYLLNKQDIIETIKYLIGITAGLGKFDDIDHLGNRRLRTVGELVGMYGIREWSGQNEKSKKECLLLQVTPLQLRHKL